MVSGQTYRSMKENKNSETKPYQLIFNRDTNIIQWGENSLFKQMVLKQLGKDVKESLALP